MSTSAPVVILAVICVPLVILWQARKDRGRQWLSYRVEEMLKSVDSQTELCPHVHPARRLLEDYLANIGITHLITIPVATLLAQALLSPVALPLAAHLPSLNSPKASDFLSDLWQVHASIIGITFVVIVLLVETARPILKSESLFTLYARESRVTPIAVFGLFFSFELACVRLAIIGRELQSPWFQVLLLIMTLSFLVFILLTIHLWAIALRFLHPTRLQRFRIETAKQAITGAVRSDARAALADAILKTECERLGLTFIALSYARQDWPAIHALRLGQVTDINLCRLDAFARMLGVACTGSSHEDTPVALLLKGLGSRITQDSRVLARLHPAVFTSGAEASLQCAFRIGPPGSGQEPPLLSDLAMLRDEALALVRDNQPWPFQQILETYYQLFEWLLRVRNAYGGDQLQVSLPTGLSSQPVWILVRHCFAIIECVISSHNPELLSSTLYLPVRVADLARSADAKRAFRDLLGLVPATYQLIARDRAHRERGRIIDLSWRYLLEMVNVKMQLRLDRMEGDIQELVDLAWYLRASTRVFNDLLKAALDARDTGTFKLFGAALDRVLEHMHHEQVLVEIDRLRWELEDGNLNKAGQTQLEDTLTRSLARATVVEQVATMRETVWFGIAAWLVHEFQHGRIAGSDFDPMFGQAASHFSNLQQLSSLYSAVMKSGESILDWESWLLAQLPEGRVHSIDTRSLMRSFYVIQGLRLTPEDLIDTDTPIVPAREFEYELQPLEQTCRELRQSRQQWQTVIADAEMERIENFIEVHRRAVAINTRKEEEDLIAQPISEAKWRSFKQEFLESWQTSIVMRQLASIHGTIVDRTSESPPEGMPPSGISVRADKAAFVDRWHISYQDWGRSFGAEMARIENRLVLINIADKLATQQQVSADDLSRSLLAAVQSLRLQGYEPSVILVDYKHWSYRTFAKNHQFTPRWDSACEPLDVVGFQGRVDGVPLVSYVTEFPGHAIVADLKALGRWIQYQVTSQAAKAIDFNLTQFDPEKAQEVVEKHPEEFEDLTPEEAVHRVLQQVHLAILERFEYVVDDPRAGILLKIAPGYPKASET